MSTKSPDLKGSGITVVIEFHQIVGSGEKNLTPALMQDTSHDGYKSTCVYICHTY